MRSILAAAALAVLLCGGPLLVSQQSSTPQSPASPLSVADVEHGLKAGVSNTRMAALVKQYGVDFELTDATEKQLRTAGANDELLLKIARAVHSSVTSGSASSNSESTTSGSAQDSKTSLPLNSTVDKTQDPCVDFYQYACGNWLKNKEIPNDQSRLGAFSELAERNLTLLRNILDNASAGNPSRDPINQKIGDFYSSCMDEKAVNFKGIDPLRTELDRLAAVEDKGSLIEAIAKNNLRGSNAFFDFRSAVDLHDSNMDIAELDQDGLSLPNRDYYINNDAHMAELRRRLVDYATQMFQLSGRSATQAADAAQTILRIETELAMHSMSNATRRDPKNRDHRLTTDVAEAMTPNLSLAHYFAATGAPSFTSLNVSSPDFFKQVDEMLASEPLDALKTYVQWHVLSASAPWLSQPFVDANFQFVQALSGQTVLQPRWKRCVRATDNALGEALGQRYVELTFGADGKQRMLKMAVAIEESVSQDIQSLDWMSEATKREAQTKLTSIANKIGYPDQWRNYSSLSIVRGDLLGNIMRANEFESRRKIGKIGKPVDRKEWPLTPPTVNAYYNPALNELVFPAGILQPPFFDRSMDDAVNFGSIGIVIGHELTHGFDDQGRWFDSHGNLHDWWTAEDTQKFHERASCIQEEYGNFVVMDDLKLDGRLTLGENIADNGGARISLAALKAIYSAGPNRIAVQTIDGYSPAQRYFVGFGRLWCEKRRSEAARMALKADPHSPGKYRVNGVVQNLPDFRQAWGCKSGQPMVSANDCRVWPGVAGSSLSADHADGSASGFYQGTASSHAPAAQAGSVGTAQPYQASAGLASPSSSASTDAGAGCTLPLPKQLRNDCVSTSNERLDNGEPVLKVTNICSEVVRVKACDGPDASYDNNGCDDGEIKPSKSWRFGLRGRGTYKYWVVAGDLEERLLVDNFDPATGGSLQKGCTAK